MIQDCCLAFFSIQSSSSSSEISLRKQEKRVKVKILSGIWKENLQKEARKNVFIQKEEEEKEKSLICFCLQTQNVDVDVVADDDYDVADDCECKVNNETAVGMYWKVIEKG